MTQWWNTRDSMLKVEHLVSRSEVVSPAWANLQRRLRLSAGLEIGRLANENG